MATRSKGMPGVTVQRRKPIVAGRGVKPTGRKVTVKRY